MTITLRCIFLSVLTTYPTMAQEDAKPALGLKLRNGRYAPTGTLVKTGTFGVYENRASQSGRILELSVVVVPALESPGARDPVFSIAGGPGQDVTQLVGGWVRHWMRRNHDIVLVSQRGTGRNNRLQCDLPGSDDDIQGYLEPMFDMQVFRKCLAELRENADLRQYSTPNAADDLNDVRAALGYDKINLYGGSYGSRVELVYLRRHPETVRCAIMNSVAPLSFRNPLYHAQSAQLILDKVFDLCAADPACSSAYGDLRGKIQTVLDRLDAAPAPATVKHPVTGTATPVRVSRQAFADSLRVIMYVDYRDVPLMIERAYQGDFDPFAQRAVDRNRHLADDLAFGMLACVTCTEDVARIRPDEIAVLTDGTFTGDFRVRAQMAVCDFWPKSNLPGNYGEPVSVDAPVLLLSGMLDPVTPPRWGAAAAKHLPRATHVVAPGSHGIGGPCIDRIQRAFLGDPTSKLDTSCVDALELSPFRLPS